MQLIDDMFMKRFGFHTIKEIESRPNWIVKVDIYNKNLKTKLKPAYLDNADQY